ncbi:MAG: 4'-phosphopantetheinyl transferase superfamily protein [Methylobacter sp.]|uniref:4'-phosphopantetheinyl transferase family protein n=1 Tax=Methylobacter sp. TaxID=2051955 RepID=UPI0027312444|nr:4'-phosphopantetheinyl transferase superfamily protein [Methylobacter sp.]MDP1665565.1 4'-phosphopantetheinyl transferase superfamily protein [Methylobacter sp.]
MTIDVWLEQLAVTDEEHRYYWSLLDKNEQDKASRFVQAMHGRRYVVSHGKLRLILSGYLGMPPEKIGYAEQAFGKPVIVINGLEHQVKFNLAHSVDKMLVAVGANEQIGVDIEVWNSKIDCAAIANLCFAEVERRFWNGLPKNSKDEFFYRLWTRKESFVKAVGVGLGLDVSKVVSSAVGATRFLSVPEGYGSAGDWVLVDLDFDRGISAALTVPAKCYNRIELRRLEPR